MSDELRKRLREQEVDFLLTDAAKSFLAKEGYDPQYGARPLRRAIQKHIEDRLSEDLLMGIIQKGDTFTIDEKDGALTVTKSITEPETEESATK
jgi:ATP-dependent Clp protease ATP-binding subunit ClpC